jgi:hypothetical protein
MLDAAYKQEGGVGWVIFGDCVREYIDGKRAGNQVYGLTLNTGCIVSVSVREAIAPPNGPLIPWSILISCSDGREYLVCRKHEAVSGTLFGSPIRQARFGWETREAALEAASEIVFHGNSGTAV